jgi:hypothetical protein
MGDLSAPLIFIFIRLAVAAESLSAAACASLNITSLYVNLTFYHRTIVARTHIRPPSHRVRHHIEHG